MEWAYSYNPAAHMKRCVLLMMTFMVTNEKTDKRQHYAKQHGMSARQHAHTLSQLTQQHKPGTVLQH